MICDSDEAVRREFRIALSHKLGGTTNPKTIETLIGRYKKAYQILFPTHPQLSLIDTTHMGEEEMVKFVATNTLNILESKSKNGTLKT